MVLSHPATFASNKAPMTAVKAMSGQMRLLFVSWEWPAPMQCLAGIYFLNLAFAETAIAPV
ncbi:MAG: hypothetical protein BWZ10_02148 [candidate division BRC1 bacterium ADurb.BinA364]|nr:MAG: hypothetical protein BWZ10_02148 [candidate division BRC1 bacterium ADurb.BinA364]